MKDKEKRELNDGVISIFKRFNILDHRATIGGLRDDILKLIDSLQEEPAAPKVLEDMLNAKTASESLGISQEEHDRIVGKLIYGKEPELVDADDLPNKEEEPVSDEIGNYNHTAVLEGLGYQSKEEPVNEDLEKAEKEWLTPQLDKSYADYGETKMMELTRFDGYAMLDAIEFGAKWQKEQMMKDVVECDIEGTIIGTDGNFGLARIKGDYNYGDKVKLIILKED